MSWDFARAVGRALPEFGWAISALLLSVRLSALFLLTPVLHAFDVPPAVRVLFILGLSALLVLGLPNAAALSPKSVGELILGAARELALGLVMALAVLTAFGAVSMAGRLIDVQIGFGVAQVFDPVTRREIPLVSSVFDKLAVIVFFAVNGHHALLRGIAFSLERFPLGRPWSIDVALPAVLRQVAALFSLGFALAAPVVVCLLLVELALGVVARNLPQVNMFVIGVPVKVVAGVAALAIWLGGAGNAMTRAYESIYRTWDGVFATSSLAGVR